MSFACRDATVWIDGKPVAIYELVWLTGHEVAVYPGQPQCGIYCAIGGSERLAVMHDRERLIAKVWD